MEYKSIRRKLIWIQLKKKIINETDLSIIAIQNYGPSGSIFLASLLDNHPNILSVPALYILDYYKFWEELNNKNINNLVKMFIKSHSHWFNKNLAHITGAGFDQMGEKMNQKLYISENHFRDNLLKIFKDQEYPSRKTFLYGIYISYANVLGRTISKPIFIDFPVHSMQKKYVEYLVNDFGKVKFIYTIRKPVQGIGSTIKHIKKYNAPINAVECALSLILNNYCQHIGPGFFVESDRPYLQNYYDESKAIKLEDLHNNSKYTLERLINWLGLSWDDSLLTSTFDGKKWWNRPETNRISGFGKEIISKSHSDILNSFDRIRLHALLFHRYNIWGYETHQLVKFTLIRFFLFFTLIIPLKSEYKILYSRLIYTIRNPLIKLLKKYSQYLIDSFKYTIVHRLNLKIALKLKTIIIEYTKSPFFKLIELIIVGIIKLIFFPFILVFIPILIFPVLLRDYLMIRWWLYRGWFINRISLNKIVRLL